MVRIAGLNPPAWVLYVSQRGLGDPVAAYLIGSALQSALAPQPIPASSLRTRRLDLLAEALARRGSTVSSGPSHRARP
jgi:hypothetical protein